MLDDLPPGELCGFTAEPTTGAQIDFPIGQFWTIGPQVTSPPAIIKLTENGRTEPWAEFISSNAGTDPGSMGIGWNHNWEIGLTVTPCDEVILTGGEGAGVRFVPDEQEGFKAVKGYHGTLIKNVEDNTFDYYTLDGMRYHYRFIVGGTSWALDYIEDTNGNRLDAIYNNDPDNFLITHVRDSAGRAFTFEYETMGFGFWSGDVLTRVSIPSGARIDFEYDDWGNLVRASREAILDETYTYHETDLEDRHLLSSLTDQRRAT